MQVVKNIIHLSPDSLFTEYNKHVNYFYSHVFIFATSRTVSKVS